MREQDISEVLAMGVKERSLQNVRLVLGYLKERKKRTVIIIIIIIAICRDKI